MLSIQPVLTLTLCIAIARNGASRAGKRWILLSALTALIVYVVVPNLLGQRAAFSLVTTFFPVGLLARLDTVYN